MRSEERHSEASINDIQIEEKDRRVFGPPR
jgi:hypothetical protein